MNSMLSIWLQFGLCTALIGYAGLRLSRYGDAIAALTGMSRNWVGLILLATVTSLPELVTGVSAVTIASAPDIAIGDVLGSCVFNLAILAGIDLFYRRGALYAVASGGHVMSAGFGVLALAGIALAILLARQGVLPTLGHVSIASLFIVLLYLVAMRSLYITEKRRGSPTAASSTHGASMSLRQALLGYAAAAVVIVGAGIWLPQIGVELARQMGWSHSFVGTLFIAFATSMPELATTWGAVRIGAIDMALGNLLGSNLFDVLILAIDDVAYLPGSIFANVQPVNALSALTACMMSGAVVVALTYRPVSRIWNTVNWVSLFLLTLYFFTVAVQYLQGQ